MTELQSTWDILNLKLHELLIESAGEGELVNYCAFIIIFLWIYC